MFAPTFICICVYNFVAYIISRMEFRAGKMVKKEKKLANETAMGMRELRAMEFKEASHMMGKNSS